MSKPVRRKHYLAQAFCFGAIPPQQPGGPPRLERIPNFKKREISTRSTGEGRRGPGARDDAEGAPMTADLIVCPASSSCNSTTGASSTPSRRGIEALLEAYPHAFDDGSAA
jgi:hypothetical protein